MIDLNWVETILWTDLLSWLESQWKDRQAPNLVVYPLPSSSLSALPPSSLTRWLTLTTTKINHCDGSFAILLPIASLCCITGCSVGDWVESVYNWRRPFSSPLHNNGAPQSFTAMKTSQQSLKLSTNSEWIPFSPENRAINFLGPVSSFLSRECLHLTGAC